MSDENVLAPYTAFNFEVILNLDSPPSGVNSPVCSAAFSDCDGLEMTMEPKVVREGGNNQQHIHLMGPTSYAQLTLKRGMTKNDDLWKWFIAAGQTGRLSTAQGQVNMKDVAGNLRVVFTLKDCLPVKMRGSALNARTGEIAIEEMQLVYTQLMVKHLETIGSGDSGIIGNTGVLSVSDSPQISTDAGLSIS